MTVREMLERMDAQELAEWHAYDRTNDEDWIKNYKSQNIDEEAMMKQMQAFFGSKASK
jgi:hypothetical protein